MLKYLNPLKSQEGNFVVKVESDHNPIISKFKIQWKTQLNQQSTEVFILKNKQCQKSFKKQHPPVKKIVYLCYFRSNNQTERFLKKLEILIYKCFKKIRVTERVVKDKETLYKKWKSLKNKTEEKRKSELKGVEKTSMKKKKNHFCLEPDPVMI